jgi:DNA-binding winged helix-turn-helix (wHTH) protein
MDKTYYDFAGVRFTPAYTQIENLETGKKTKLSPIRCQFLLALVENYPQTVSYETLRQKVWVNAAEVNDSFRHNAQSTKNGLLKLFKAFEIKADLIKFMPGEGYFIDAPVKEVKEILVTVSENENQKNFIPASKTPTVRGNYYFGFALAYSLLYGLLYWIALLLEVAYQFDRFGNRALWSGAPLVLWIAGTSLAGLLLTRELIARKKASAFFAGFAFFAGGAGAACLMLSYFLPNESVTQAAFQTQPAFAAYLKNALIYFLPLGVFFILIPFQNAWQRKYFPDAETERSFFVNLLPAHLFGVWLLALGYSIFSTFYLLDNLLLGEFHALFVVLTFLRFFVYFGLSLACLLWYRSILQSETGKLSPAASGYRQWQIAGLLALLLLSLTTFLTAMNHDRRTPHLKTIEAVSEVKGGQQFFVRLHGANFNAESVSVKVVGEGCPETTPCFVPNSALQKHSAISDTILDSVPLTLAQGDFQIYAQNENSQTSNFVVLSVP